MKIQPLILLTALLLCGCHPRVGDVYAYRSTGFQNSMDPAMREQFIQVYRVLEVRGGEVRASTTYLNLDMSPMFTCTDIFNEEHCVFSTRITPR
jgi:hypothetical protein